MLFVFEGNGIDGYCLIERVRIVGGWQSILDSEDHMHLIINEEKKIRFDTSHAGPGNYFRLFFFLNVKLMDIVI